MARTKGAVSNVLIAVEVLSNKFKPGMKIPISRKFAEANGLGGQAVYSTVIKPTETVEAPEDKIQIREIS